MQGPIVTVAQPPVVIAPQPSAGKLASSLSSAVPIACAEMPTVGQLVSSMCSDFFFWSKTSVFLRVGFRYVSCLLYVGTDGDVHDRNTD